MPLYNFKVTLGSTTLTQNTPTVKVSQSFDSSATDVMSAVKNDITSEWDANMVPTEIFSTAEDDSQNGGDDDENDGENDGEMKENGEEEEHDMEIDVGMYRFFNLGITHVELYVDLLKVITIYITSN